MVLMGEPYPKAQRRLLAFTKVHPLNNKKKTKQNHVHTQADAPSWRMPFMWTKNGAESKVFAWLDTVIIGRRERGPIIVQTRATQQEGGVGEKLETSSEKAEVIRVQAGVNQSSSKKCYKQQWLSMRGRDRVVRAFFYWEERCIHRPFGQDRAGWIH